jgi:hypothetical protein
MQQAKGIVIDQLVGFDLERTIVDIAEAFQVTVTWLNVLNCERLDTRPTEAAISMFQYLALISVRRHGDLSQEHAEDVFSLTCRLETAFGARLRRLP